MAMLRLTFREAQVLECLSRGLTNYEIAAELHVHTSTVKAHLTTIYRKLGVSNRTQAAVRFLSPPAAVSADTGGERGSEAQWS